MEYDNTSDALESKVEAVMHVCEDVYSDDVYASLEEHIKGIEGTNRGNTSSAFMHTRELKSSPIMLKLQNSVSTTTLFHEIGHALAGALGYDCSQEATERATNKSNWSRWPQFSFGKKDSPRERFMLRRYGHIDDVEKLQVADIEAHAERSDLFWYRNAWLEPCGYQYVHNRGEHKRYVDPMVADGVMDVTSVGSSINPSTTITNEDDVQVANRYELTPGLDSRDWENPIRALVAEINKQWFECVTLVRKRGDAREEGILKSPGGERASYYVMNANEFFAEINAKMMALQSDMLNDGSRSRIEDHIDRLRDRTDVIEAYEDALIG
jgi:hypothetical protein